MPDKQPRMNLFNEPEQLSLDLDRPAPDELPTPAAPVECLGRTFANDEARRQYFLAELAQKLKDPAFRQIEGFPLGRDEDILALSDPPYYTACPNPFLEDFVKLYGKPYDPTQKYSREPFATDVSEGKNDPIYNAHSYHTKVPHKAIMRYILHYTEPGDLVFDGFCGTGMTGVAAQLCGDKPTIESLGYRVAADGTISRAEEDPSGKTIWQPFSRLGARRAILNDLSPVATFIAYNYNTPVDVKQFEREAKRILQQVEAECGWMYETRHSDGSSGKINYTVWSDVFVCSECSNELVLWNEAVDSVAGQVRDEFPCPNCGANLTKRSMQRAWVTKFDAALNQSIKQAKQVPILIHYNVGKKRYEKKPDDFDQALIEQIEKSDILYWYPTNQIPKGDKTGEPIRIGITHVHHFYTRRNLIVLALLQSLIAKSPIERFLLYQFDSLVIRQSKLTRFLSSYYFHGGGGWVGTPLSGTLYIPSFSIEVQPFETWENRVPKTFARVQKALLKNCATTTNDAGKINLLSDSADYIFLDPPFGSNLMYSELNFLWESWLKVFTNNKLEAIENKVQGKALDDYRSLMTDCFREAFRVLKPGRWMTVEFSNTQASVWNSIQNALQEAGFVVANVSALDKQQGSFKAVTTTTAVKQDLVISAYKPNGGLEGRVQATNGGEIGVWEFVRSHLGYLPIFKVNKQAEAEFNTERDPRILFDRMVAYYVQHGYPVPLSSAEFQAGLAQRFVPRHNMYFLPEQVPEYDQKKAKSGVMAQYSYLVQDERTAINWIEDQLKRKPSTYQEIQPDFMKQTAAGWKKYEAQPVLHDLLEDNFLRYESGPIPSQLVSWLKLSSTYRPIVEAHPASDFTSDSDLLHPESELQQASHERWYVPDPNKAADLEKKRERALLKEFEEYRTTASRRLKIFRIEAIRAGFKNAWQKQDYQTIVEMGQRLPDAVLQEDPQLIMWYDNADLRTS